MTLGQFDAMSLFLNVLLDENGFQLMPEEEREKALATLHPQLGKELVDAVSPGLSEARRAELGQMKATGEVSGARLQAFMTAALQEQPDKIEEVFLAFALRFSHAAGFSGDEVEDRVVRAMDRFGEVMDTWAGMAGGSASLPVIPPPAVAGRLAFGHLDEQVRAFAGRLPSELGLTDAAPDAEMRAKLQDTVYQRLFKAAVAALPPKGQEALARRFGEGDHGESWEQFWQKAVPNVSSLVERTLRDTFEEYRETMQRVDERAAMGVEERALEYVKLMPTKAMAGFRSLLEREAGETARYVRSPSGRSLHRVMRELVYLDLERRLAMKLAAQVLDDDERDRLLALFDNTPRGDAAWSDVWQRVADRAPAALAVEGLHLRTQGIEALLDAMQTPEEAPWTAQRLAILRLAATPELMDTAAPYFVGFGRNRYLSALFGGIHGLLIPPPPAELRDSALALASRDRIRPEHNVRLRRVLTDLDVPLEVVVFDEEAGKQPLFGFLGAAGMGALLFVLGWIFGWSAWIAPAALGGMAISNVWLGRVGMRRGLRRSAAEAPDLEPRVGLERLAMVLEAGIAERANSAGWLLGALAVVVVLLPFSLLFG